MVGSSNCEKRLTMMSVSASLNPRWSYSLPKALGENLVANACKDWLIIRYFNTESYFINETIFQAIFLFLIININLAVFNMLPIAPLDGSQIFSSILPREIALKLQIYGPQVLLGLILFGIITGHSII